MLTTADVVVGKSKNMVAVHPNPAHDEVNICLLYTSDAADERSSVDLGGRRIIKKKKQQITKKKKKKTDKHTQTHLTSPAYELLALSANAVSTLHTYVIECAHTVKNTHSA